jgi:hemoglobin/transferrin/lactoferrin receptor protein
VRDFPNSKTREDAVYAQLEYSLGALQVIPGVRLDRYRLTPQPDAIFIADNPGISPTRLSETATSPKLGALYALNDVWTLHGQYATGFRAPPYNDVNVGFTNLQFGYTAIPNSNLKSERSRGIEAGIRASAPLGFLDLTIYRNRYDDFIESFFLVGRDSASNLSIFQSRNLNEVAIRGAELRAGMQLDELNPAFEGFSLRAAASYSHGDQLQSDRPLNSIDPRKAVLGLQYQAARFGVEMVGSFVGRKGRIDESSGSQFRPAGYAKYDLLAHWQIGHHFTLNLGVFNVFDRAYFD